MGRNKFKSKEKLSTATEFTKRKIVISLLMCIFMFFLPFISYMHKEKITQFISKFYSSKTGYITDWFLYQKELCVILFAISIVTFFILEHLIVNKTYRNIPLKQKNLRLPLILIGVYAFFLILSGIFSSQTRPPRRQCRPRSSNRPVPWWSGPAGQDPACSSG